MIEDLKIGDRIKLEHIKSNSFIDSVVVNFDDKEFSYVELPGDVAIYWGDGWERVA